jgi:hypothetical protein
MPIRKKTEKGTYGVCGSRKKDKNLCDEPTKPEDTMKEFSCEK